MTFADIKNNDFLVKRVTNSIAHGRISHAYIFEGDAYTDKIALADVFAKAVLCRVKTGYGCDSCVSCQKIEHRNHEDILYVEKDGASTKDEAIEELQEKLKKKPYAGERNIAVIENADTMTARAQNRLLKTLEEPFAGTILILLSENTSALAETILSRCVILRWTGTSPADLREFPEAADLMEAIFNGAPFYRSKSKLKGMAENREDAYKLLDAMEIVCGEHIRKRSKYKSSAGAAIRHLEEARGDITRGMNVGYTLKNMILKMEENK